MKPDTQAVFPGDLHADFTRALPGGKLDDATYEAFAARILQSYANGLEMDAERLP